MALLCLGLCGTAAAQGIGGRLGNMTNGGGLANNPFSHRGGEGKDSLSRPHKHVEENITIHYQYLDDVKTYSLDTSINDFYRYIPLKDHDAYLGNLGTPTRSLIYEPSLQPGWDPGFHAFDDYRLTLDRTPFYETTRPYTVLEYLIGAKQEQMIDVFHTQNPRDNFNFGFHYRKINAPGYFRNQNTNDDSYNVFLHYNTRNKRYNLYASFISNKLNTGENGGIRNDSLLTDPDFTDRRTIPTNLGGDDPSPVGFFSTPIATKSAFKETGFLFRQQYDWGKGDTLQINDTTRKYIFNPVFRVEHTLRTGKIAATYSDSISGETPDYYLFKYDLDNLDGGKVLAEHNWTYFSNDLSVMQFPVRGNLAHFLKAGASYETVRGQFLYNSLSFSNILGHFEYHNTTKNRKWELDALGQLYLAGNNFGDYHISGSLSRYLNDKLGDVKVAFGNVNQTPSFVYRFFQSNRFLSLNTDLKKSNTTLLQFIADNQELKYHLAVNYYLLTNYTYFKSFLESGQYSTAFNLLQVLFSKQFTLGHFNWYVDLAYQQTDGAAPLHVPNFWTRNRFTFEGTFFKNLILCTGVELRYNTAYYADDYSPVLQQFVSQRVEKIGNDYPDVGAFIHFRIKTFTAFVRAENLNAFVGRNIIQIPHYPYPDFAFRVGLKWGYIN
ncbi:putative porin [Compostibacter hankyongensis]|uniref:Porin n=2 Tax=Compostibacter hankyongensis TaxID=1007089 RepID=A0ABP8FY30_9BACT